MGRGGEKLCAVHNQPLPWPTLVGAALAQLRLMQPPKPVHYNMSMANGSALATMALLLPDQN
jgi:hypothetical protein